MSLRVWIWLLSLSVLWGGSFFFAKVAIDELPPLVVVFARVGLAAVALNLMLIARRESLFRRSTPWATFFAMGLPNNLLPFSLSYAFAGIYGRRFKTMGIAPMAAATGQVTASAVLILPIMLLVDRPWTLPVAPSPVVWAALAGLALLSTALAYVLYFRILAAAGAINLLLVTFLIPLTAILLGAAFLGERLTARHFAGMALIGIGLAVIDGRIGRVLRPAK